MDYPIRIPRLRRYANLIPEGGVNSPRLGAGSSPTSRSSIACCCGAFAHRDSRVHARSTHAPGRPFCIAVIRYQDCQEASYHEDEIGIRDCEEDS